MFLRVVHYHMFLFQLSIHLYACMCPCAKAKQVLQNLHVCVCSYLFYSIWCSHFMGLPVDTELVILKPVFTHPFPLLHCSSQPMGFSVYTTCSPQVTVAAHKCDQPLFTLPLAAGSHIWRDTHTITKLDKDGTPYNSPLLLLT